MLSDRLDIEPHDPELLGEIQMLGNPMVACSASSTRLSADAIDAALSLSRATGQDMPESRPPLLMLL
jgi:hypothetical protein